MSIGLDLATKGSQSLFAWDLGELQSPMHLHLLVFRKLNKDLNTMDITWLANAFFVDSIVQMVDLCHVQFHESILFYTTNTLHFFLYHTVPC